MKKLVSVLLASALMLSLVACAESTPAPTATEAATTAATAAATQVAAETPAVESIKLTFANVDTDEHPVSQSIVYFADKVNEFSGGNMNIDTYFAGVLGEENATTEATLAGEIDITRVNGGNVAAWVPACGIFSIPFLFTDYNDLKSVVTKPNVQSYFEKQFEAAGFKLLAIWYDGVRHAYHTNKFFETADDLVGVKMRTMTSPMIVTAFETLGVKPTPINYTEVYTSLQQKVVDAAENNMNALYDAKHYEVAPFITGTGHLMFPAVVIMNLDKWNSLSSAQQEVLTKAVDATLDYEFDLVHQKEVEALDLIQKDGGKYQEFPLEEKKKLQEKLTPFYDTVKTELGEEVVDLIVNRK